MNLVLESAYFSKINHEMVPANGNNIKTVAKLFIIFGRIVFQYDIIINRAAHRGLCTVFGADKLKPNKSAVNNLLNIAL